ncbi:ferrous iron transport protein B [Anaerosacchariphilus polymeriproducens]|uniref:Ferrous iron transport protein B n=1 Tax=Anaerosacchariphilus polymeriproducens TaxID=1812858 RepID=A0A371AST3_9FIRM|nr:ferrous iron transport protein B [Anaerosacchariphilus polymeriproducens]RDU22636.1 ferrous iron transport protein B [Anaerosacchariphilus polymeriproducens]
MGLTFQSTQNASLTDMFYIKKNNGEAVIALAGNPNTGKSTVFNSLTGLHQHTGNWPGKTVVNARGEFTYKGRNNILVDLPGTYSLFASSVEEEVAREFLLFGNADAVIVVADATCIERNLNLVIQVMELTKNVILCINLIDEAVKRNIIINKKRLQKELGIPVVLCAARQGIGMNELKEIVFQVTNQNAKFFPVLMEYSKEVEDKIQSMQSLLEPFFNQYKGRMNLRWIALRALDSEPKFLDSILSKCLKQNPELLDEINKIETRERIILRDKITEQIYKKAEEVRNKCVNEDHMKRNRERMIDNYITSKKFGIPIMLLTLAAVFWLTIVGANKPSELIASVLFGLEDKLTELFMNIHAAKWLHGVVVLGLYRTLAWVISVMLPPMAIFFPLLTILEDLGYLPRVAFNLDHLFKKACAHGKQCLTMCMGLGCNAAGVISCRIIDSPRERIIAILTNNFVPCNGRFPTLITISMTFFVVKGRMGSGMIPVLFITGLVVIGILVTLLVSYLLSKTLLKGIPSTFTLELPPYRVPQIGRVLYTSMIDRTIFVLWRAVIIAAPAGAITWILGNVYIGNLSIISYGASFLNPIAQIIGLDGYILMAFILGLPANEIVLPILMMAYLSTGSMVEFENIDSLKKILLEHGWTYLTALNVMLFSLLHWPCGTTLLTIKKESGSIKWTALSFIIPTAIAFGVCFITTTLFKAFNLV